MRWNRLGLAVAALVATGAVAVAGDARAKVEQASPSPTQTVLHAPRVLPPITYEIPVPGQRDLVPGQSVDFFSQTAGACSSPTSPAASAVPACSRHDLLTEDIPGLQSPDTIVTTTHDGTTLSLSPPTGGGLYVMDPHCLPVAQVSEGVVTCIGLDSVPTGYAIPFTSVPLTTPTAEVTYQPGWNLINGGTNLAVIAAQGPLYTQQPDQLAYREVPSDSSLQSTIGYWAYFATTTSGLVALDAVESVAQFVPAGHFMLIGNPFATTASIQGADVVLEFSPSSGYQRTNVLAPGAGAWVYSAQGAEIIVQPEPTEAATNPLQPRLP